MQSRHSQCLLRQTQGTFTKSITTIVTSIVVHIHSSTISHTDINGKVNRKCCSWTNGTKETTHGRGDRETKSKYALKAF